MKLLVTILLFLSCPCAAIASDKGKTFWGLVEETKQYLAIYDELTPLGDGYYRTKKLQLTKQELQKLFGEAKEADAFTKPKDSVLQEIAIELMQQKITRNIEKMIQHKEFTRYDLHFLFANTGLSVAVAPDKKLYNFSFDAKNGGSYRMMISVTHYTGLDPVLARAASSLEEEKPSGPYAIFHSDGYDRIDTISSTAGTKYVLTSTIRTCNLCFVNTVDLVSFRDSVFLQEFHHAVELRTWDEAMKYDPATRTIAVAYNTDDLTRDCSCGEVAQDNEQKQGEEKELYLRHCECLFRYDGDNFKLVRKCWELVEKEDK